MTAFLKRYTFAAKDVKSTPDGQINLATTQPLHQLEILDIPATTCVCDRNCADLGEMGDKLLIDSSLLTFDVRCMNEEFTAIWFEQCDVF